jgi:hypothetical protein
MLVSAEHYISLQLGKWIHPHEIKTAEDILSDPSSIPYTKDINEALKPHRGVLQRLLTAPNSSHYEISSKVIPAKKWLQDNNKISVWQSFPMLECYQSLRGHRL